MHTDSLLSEPPGKPQRSLVHLKKMFFLGGLVSFFMAVRGLCCYAGFSLVVASGDYSSVAAHRLLIMLDSLGAENRL